MSHTFRTAWHTAARKAGISGLTFHDLRGTAVTRLAKVECSVPEIATITGHSLKDTYAIMDSHYLHRDPALATSAIRKLEMGNKTASKAPN
jgi:integrase